MSTTERQISRYPIIIGGLICILGLGVLVNSSRGAVPVSGAAAAPLASAAVQDPGQATPPAAASAAPKPVEMPDGDGTMLEHSLFLYGSNMSNSNAHNHYPLPTSFVGGWKTVKGNRHVVSPEKTPLANVLLTFLDRVNVGADKVGDSTGKLVDA